MIALLSAAFGPQEGGLGGSAIGGARRFGERLRSV